MPENAPVHIVENPDGTSYALPKFMWDLNREQAATDLAEGQYSLREIAMRAGVGCHALRNWREHPEFKARVAERQKVFGELVMSYGLGNKAARMAALQERYDSLREVVQARGAYFAKHVPDVAGGHTGLVYEHLTKFGGEYLIDNKTIQTLGEIEKQGAIEAGQWNDGSSVGVAVQIVCPTSAPSMSQVPTVTIGMGNK